MIEPKSKKGLDDAIHVCYAVSDRKGTYTKLVGTSICSLLEHTSHDVIIHFLHDDTLSRRNRDRLQFLVERYRQQIQFHDVSGTYDAFWKEIRQIVPGLDVSRFSIATFFRLVLGEVLPEVSRLIYLDADTIINLDISCLWQESVGMNGLAAAVDIQERLPHAHLVTKGEIPADRYFNAGVLLLDMERFRQVKDLPLQGIRYLQTIPLDYLDQDILNHFFWKESRLLPSQYNTFVNMERIDERLEIYPAIYHFVNNSIGLFMADCYNRLFFHYFVRTPWCDENFLGRLVQQVYDDVQSRALSYGYLCKSRRRIVVAPKEGEATLRDSLGLQQDEKFLPLQDLQTSGLSLDGEQDLLMCFLDGESYKKLKEQLIAMGCQEGQQFINGWLMLPYGKGMSFLSEYKLFLEL